MKKNAMLKIAAILMVAVLLTTCAISSTFAKYTTNDDFDAISARVAKWGVTVEVGETNELFGKSYGTTESSLYVHTNGDKNVVAPGTTGEAPSITVSGTTEVAVSVAATADVELENWYTTPDDVNTLYCPLSVKVGDAAALTIDADETLDAFEARIEAAIVRALTGSAVDAAVTTNAGKTTIAKDYNPNATLPGNTAVEISWEWVLSSSEANDVKDTALGTNATTNGDEATISITYGVTVEQRGAADSSPVYVAPATP